MVLPNFIIAGVAKAGTTTVFDILSQHPEVGMSIMKEPNFFSNGWPKWAKTLEEYQQLFEHCFGKKAIGEATPFYFSDLESASRIKNTLGENSKIILTLRNPAKRAYSHWTHERFKYNREPLTFQEALIQEDERAKSEEVRQLKFYYPGIYRYVWISQYSDKVDHFINIFGRENTAIIILEEFIESPRKSYKDLCLFLNIDPSFSPTIKRSNPASETSAPWLTKLISTINQSTVFNMLYRKMPVPLKKNIFKFGDSLFSLPQRARKVKLTDQEVLDDATYDRLMNIFLPDIKRLERLLERDLSVWY